MSHRLSSRPDLEEPRRFYDGGYLETENVIFNEDARQKSLLPGMITAGADFSRERVLEVGCGHGVLLDLLGRLWKARSLYGVDLSGRMVAEGVRLFPSLRLVQGDGGQLPFPGGAFGVVCFADYLEHVVDPSLALAEIRRVARQVVCHVPLESGVISDLHYRWRTWLGKPTHRDLLGHLQRFRAREVDSLLAAAGFTVLSRRIEEEATHPASTFKGRLFQAPRRLLRRLPGLDRLLYGGYCYVAWCR